MPAVRKKREAKKPSIDTSKLKEFTGGSSSSKHERRMAFAKRVKKESEDIQVQISSEQEKAGKRSLWSSIGGALAGLASGIAFTATGGTSALLQGAAVGVGTYLGATGGKVAAEDPNIGKAGRKKIKSGMFYESEAHKQNIAFTDFDRKLNEGILNRSLAAGLLTTAVAGGGKLIEKMKVAKAAKVAKKAEEAAKLAKAGVSASLEQTKAAAELVTTTTGTGVGSSTNIVMPETVPEGMEMLQSITQEYSNVVPKQSVATSPSPSPHKMLARHPKTELALQKHSLGASYKSQLASFTPLSSEAAPTMMKSYMAGLKGMTSEYAQKSILASGAMSIYGYRPEMEALRPVQMITSPYQTQQRSRYT